MSNTINEDEVKKIQLDILIQIDRFCKENNIHYNLHYGTLLGAIRHDGYIPWDDDIDIAMPRNDYEQFCDIFKHSYLSVLSYRNNSDYPFPFAKVVDNRTVLVEATNVNYRSGIYVDIFPLDYVPDDLRKQRRLVKLQSFYYRVLLYKLVTNAYETSCLHRMVQSVLRFISKPISAHRLAKIIDSKAMNSAHGCCSFVAPLVGDRYASNRIFPSQIYFSSILHQFEDKKFPIPCEYDKILACMYGNYMELPPEDRRISGHIFNAFWKDMGG